MDDDTLGIMIPLLAIFMSLLIPIVYAIVDYRRRRDVVEAHHKERLAAIERGMDIPALPESFYNPYQRRPRTLLLGMIWSCEISCRILGPGLCLGEGQFLELREKGFDFRVGALAR